MAIDTDYAASPDGERAAELLDDIRFVMEREKISQSELARRSGYKQPYISQLVTGRHTIQFSTALHLAHTLGLIKFVEMDHD